MSDIIDRSENGVSAVEVKTDTGLVIYYGKEADRILRPDEPTGVCTIGYIDGVGHDAKRQRSLYGQKDGHVVRECVGIDPKMWPESVNMGRRGFAPTVESLNSPGKRALFQKYFPHITME